MNLKRNTGSPEEIKLALEIYNSNSDFLMHHIGKSSVDESFIRNELAEMEEHGFTSNLIMDGDEYVGIIEYMLREDGYVYLSLLMLKRDVQRTGMGSSIISSFEKKMVDEGANIIRIDVVNDHEPNVIPFWEKMGFVGQREERLTWGDKESTVLVMEKRFSY